MHEYRARLVRLIDGDTAVLAIDLGFRIAHEIGVRMHGYNAPETKGAQRPWGLRAAACLSALLSNADSFTVRTQKDATEKYGRYLATVIGPGGNSINEAMRAWCLATAAELAAAGIAYDPLPAYLEKG